MTIKRIQVKETQRYWGDFDGTLESIIAALQSELDDGWAGLEYDYEPYEDGAYYLYKFREETDKEYEKRLKRLEKEKADKAKAKVRKLAQLKTLLDKVIFELEMTHFLIDDATESHNIQEKADQYYQQYLNILHSKI